MGCAGFSDMVCITIGYQLGDAAIIGWIEYLQIPIAYVLQVWVLDQGVDYLEIIGAIAVLIGCLLPLSRELWLYMRAESQAQNESDDVDGDYQPLI